MNSKEYTMLRDEILHLDTMVNNTINFFYVFVSAVLIIAINQTDSLYALIAYVVIIPAYLMTLSKEKGIFKIGAYLYVFQEEDFNWERRNRKMNGTNVRPALYKIQSVNLPFLFVSTFVMIIFFIKTSWSDIGYTCEFVKVIIAVGLYVMQLTMIWKNRIINIEKYIPLWEKIKSEE